MKYDKQQTIQCSVYDASSGNMEPLELNMEPLQQDK